MNNLFLALVDGAGKDLGSGGIIAIFSIVLVFLILGIIIAITYVVGLVIQKFAKTEKAEESTTPAAATAITASAPVSNGAATILAPIAGKVIDIKVKVGDFVKKGQVVAIIEAMKLENEIPASAEGKVVEVKVSKGSAVNNKDVLIVLG